MQQSFVFYKSFFDAIQLLKEKDRLAVYQTICDFAINNAEIKAENLSKSAKMALVLIEPQLKANAIRYKSAVEKGKKGGRPKKAELLCENNLNDNVNDNENKNVNENLNENENENAGENLSHSQKLFADSFPNKQIDCDFDDNKYNINLLISKIKQSDFLKNQPNITLKSCLKNYDKIIAGGYKDYAPPNPAKSFIKHEYPDGYLNNLYSDPDKLEF